MTFAAGIDEPDQDGPQARGWRTTDNGIFNGSLARAVPGGRPEQRQSLRPGHQAQWARVCAWCQLHPQSALPAQSRVNKIMPFFKACTVGSVPALPNPRAMTTTSQRWTMSRGPSL